MRQIFETELNQLGEDLVNLSALVHQAVQDAGTALLTKDRELAQEVIVADDAIDALERDIDERCILLLAQQAPVASDLRQVVTGLRISASLERMGDLARHIAEIARGRYPSLAFPDELTDIFTQMHSAATAVAAQTTRLLTESDITSSTEVEQEDDRLDELHREALAVLLSIQPAPSSQQVIDATLLARYFERFGDHAVSVARRIVFLVTGDFDS